MSQLRYSRRKTAYRQGRGAFTLAELLVAIAVLSILTLLLCGILNQVSSTWSEIRAQIDRHQNGRSILNVMASELRVAALPQDRANKYSLQMVVNPYVLISDSNYQSKNASTYLNPCAIFWQAPIATSTTRGNMAEVGYFIRWSTGSNPRATLCRFFVNPDDPNGNYQIYQSNPTVTVPITVNPAAATPTNPWLTTTLLDSVAPGTGPTYKGWFADNVIGLWVRCLDANGYPITRTASLNHLDSATTNYSFDSRLGYLALPAGFTTAPAVNTYITKSAYTDGGADNEQILCALPSTVEIAIVVIDAQTANFVTAVPSYMPFMQTTVSASVNSPVAPYTTYSPVNFWNDINTFLANLKTSQPRVWQGAHVYSIRVPLVNGG